MARFDNEPKSDAERDCCGKVVGVLLRQLRCCGGL